jgi:hypothetical protein
VAAAVFTGARSGDGAGMTAGDGAPARHLGTRGLLFLVRRAVAVLAPVREREVAAAWEGRGTWEGGSGTGGSARGAAIVRGRGGRSIRLNRSVRFIGLFETSVFEKQRRSVF